MIHKPKKSTRRVLDERATIAAIINKRQRTTTRAASAEFRFTLKWRLLVLVMLMIPLISYINWVNDKVRKQFDGKRWAIPASVYARPMEFYKDVELSADMLDEELKAIGYQQTSQLSQAGQYRRRGDQFFLMTRGFKFWDSEEPSRTVQINIQEGKVESVINLNNNQPNTLMRLEPKLIGKIYPTKQEDRLIVHLTEVPKFLITGMIATEDRQFYYHNGLSVRGILRAMLANYRAGELTQGGSTITQQLVKNMLLTSERSVNRKLNEAMMSLSLEWHYTKEQILEAYLNEVFLGQDGKRAIHGVGMAAWFYFNRPVDELKLHEAAMLVGLVKAASDYNPRKYPERAKSRRDLVLDLMADQGYIKRIEANKAKELPLGVVDESTSDASKISPYPAFLELVHHQLREYYRESDLSSDGLQVFTTLDPILQRHAEEAMTKGIVNLEKTHGGSTRRLEGAMVVTSTDNGEVLALVNGRNPRFMGFNRPLNAARQIGSLVKAAIYLTALENGFSLTSTLNDSPYTWVDKKTGVAWRPKNYDFRSHGQVPLINALANSYNLAAVRLASNFGVDKIRNTISRMGVKRKVESHPTMLLGSLGLTPLEVAQMYHTIASGGFRTPLATIRYVMNQNGKQLRNNGFFSEPAFDSGSVFLLQHALQHAFRAGTGKRVGQQFPSSLMLGGKTGTTNEMRDSWFAGFGGQYSVVTWLGRDDNKPMGLSGGQGALQVWGSFMKSVKMKAVKPVTPNNVEWRTTSGGMSVPFIANRNPSSPPFSPSPEKSFGQKSVANSDDLMSFTVSPRAAKP
jgi:penicillin-binding protein 1B